MLKKILFGCFVFGILFSELQLFKHITVEAAGINGAAIVDSVDYKWSEISWGSNRGITFNPGQHVYQLSPNPHNDPWYNKNQVKFYNQVVNQISIQGNTSGWTATNWPMTIKNINVNNIMYTLTVR